MKFEEIVTLKITEDVPDELVSRVCSYEEFCENLKSLIKSELPESGQVEILEDFVQVVRAKWVGNNGTFCSNCGKSDANAFNHHIPYCWNCGAYMDGDTNEID